MACYVEGGNRAKSFLLLDSIDDDGDENNLIRVIDAFVDELDLGKLGFGRSVPAPTGRRAYHPGVMLKLYVYGDLSRIPSSRRLKRETQRNIELLWLIGRLAPESKTVADFRRDNGLAIRIGVDRPVIVRVGCDHVAPSPFRLQIVLLHQPLELLAVHHDTLVA